MHALAIHFDMWPLELHYNVLGYFMMYSVLCMLFSVGSQ